MCGSDDGEGEVVAAHLIEEEILCFFLVPSILRELVSSRRIFGDWELWFWFLIDADCADEDVLFAFPVKGVKGDLRLACVVSCEVCDDIEGFSFECLFQLFRIVPVCDEWLVLLRDWVVPSSQHGDLVPLLVQQFCAIGGDIACASEEKYVHCSTPLGLGLWIDFFEYESSCIEGLNELGAGPGHLPCGVDHKDILNWLCLVVDSDDCDSFVIELMFG